MLSLFPVLFSYNLAAPFVFRLISGALFVYFAYTNITKNRASKIALFERIHMMSSALWLWVLVILEVLGGLMLIVGTYTQAAALGLSVILIFGLVVKIKNRDVLPWSVGFLFLLLVITASLLVLGPGFYAFDLPF